MSTDLFSEVSSKRDFLVVNLLIDVVFRGSSLVFSPLTNVMDNTCDILPFFVTSSFLSEVKDCGGKGVEGCSQRTVCIS